MLTPFSPGIAQGCAELLSLTEKHSQSVESLFQAFPFISSIPTDKLLSMAQMLDWIRTNESGKLILTSRGTSLLSIFDYTSLLQRMLLDYVDVARPSWVQNAVSGRARVMSFAGSEIYQVFVEANLASGTNDQTVSFWDALAARARGQKSVALNEIGRQGERLSLEYERRRTEREPKWISIESNEDGYDVLSVMSKDDPGLLTIEVKTSTMGISGSFYLTANEWERAQETPCHLFHLWDISKKVAQLGIVTVNELREHVPANNGCGKWQTVEVPFKKFKTAFFRVPC